MHIMELVRKKASRVDEQITYRSALPEEGRAIADLICQAGGGLYEFLLDDLVPFVSACDIVTWGVGMKASPFSYLNCRVAASGSSQIVGVINLFPANLIGKEAFTPFGSDRFDLIRPMLQLQDWGSMLLNAIAVTDGHRGRGIGKQLINWAETHTLQSGLTRLSLHVWADNTPAIQLYKSHGFIEIGVAELASHPMLPHRGGSILMQKSLE
jgi:GNAT superfamily N-acetyltransferase